MSAVDHSSGRAWSPWPTAILAFFAVAIAGLAAFIVFCSRHPADLVEADYYEQEMRYGQQLDRIERTQRSSQAARVSYDDSTRTISIILPAQQAANHVAGTIQLYRPSSSDLDREFKLEPDAGGVQKIDVRAMNPGLWKVRISWTAGREEYFVDQKIVIRPGAS